MLTVAMPNLLAFCRIWDLIWGELCHPHRHRRTVSPQPNCIRDLCEQQVLTDIVHFNPCSHCYALFANVLGVCSTRWCKEVCIILVALKLDGTLVHTAFSAV